MDKPDNKKAAVWRRNGENMKEQDKLLERGLDCLTVLRSIFDDCLQARNMEEARIWLHEYSGACKVLDAQGLYDPPDKFHRLEQAHSSGGENP